MSKIINTVLTVREDAGLQRAIAADISGMDDKQLTENFLQQMSVDYPVAKRPKKSAKLIENPSDEGTNTLINDGQDSGRV